MPIDSSSEPSDIGWVDRAGEALGADHVPSDAEIAVENLEHDTAMREAAKARDEAAGSGAHDAEVRAAKHNGIWIGLLAGGACAAVVFLVVAVARK